MCNCSGLFYEVFFDLWNTRRQLLFREYECTEGTFWAGEGTAAN